MYIMVYHVSMVLQFHESRFMSHLYIATSALIVQSHDDRGVCTLIIKGVNGHFGVTDCQVLYWLILEIFQDLAHKYSPTVCAIKMGFSNYSKINGKLL